MAKEVLELTYNVINLCIVLPKKLLKNVKYPSKSEKLKKLSWVKLDQSAYALLT